MTGWEPARKGGFRRTEVAQEGQARGRCQPGTERRSDKAEVGGSNPSLGTNHWKLAWRERLGLPDCPYVIRWRFETPWGSLRVHHWLGPDDDRAFHDHPWWFVTWVVRGGYTDWNDDGDDHIGRWQWRYRTALHRHTVIPDDGGCWTMLMTGAPVRAWGFWLGDKFIKANKWFLTYGHHPCS